MTYKELIAHLIASQSNLSLSFPVEISKYVTNIYTPVVFKMFQIELCEAYDCILHVLEEMGTITNIKLLLIASLFISQLNIHHVMKH